MRKTEILLLQSNKEIAFSKSYFGERFPSLSLVAWTPSTIDSLRNEDLNYSTAGDLFDQLWDWKEKETSIQEIGKWCNYVDNLIQEEIPEFRRMNIRPFINHFLHKRMHFLMYQAELDALFQLRSSLSTVDVYYFEYPNEKYAPLSRAIRAVESQVEWNLTFFPLQPTWSLSTEKTEKRWFPNFINQKDISENSKFKMIKSLSRRVLSSYLDNEWIPINLKNVFASLTFGKCTFKPSNALVFHLDKQETRPLLANLIRSRKDLNLVFWDELCPNKRPKISIPVTNILKRLNEDPIVSTTLTYRDVNLFDLIWPELKRTIEEDLDIFFRNAVWFNDVLATADIRFVISAFESPLLYLFYAQCNNSGTPLILNYHGGTSGIFEDAPLQFLNISSTGKSVTHLLFTPENCEHQRTVANRCETTTNDIPVGSTYLNRLFKEKTFSAKKYLQNSKHIKVCYAIGLLTDFVDRKAGTHSNAAMYDLLLDVVERLGDAANIELTVKWGYDAEQLDLTIVKNHPKVKFIDSNVKLVDLKNDYDLFILPWLSSTFLELSTGNIPILLLVAETSYILRNEAQAAIENRATLSLNKHDFLDHIDALAEYGRKSILFNQMKSANTDFFHMFACPRQTDPPVSGATWIQQNLLEGIS